jgi:crossover junction endodeoxyribonuclease RuvC
MSSAKWWRRYSLRHRGKDSKEIPDPVRVIGIDPGSRICGYGIIEPRKTGHHNSYTYIASGRIELSPGQELSVRLHEIYGALVDIMREYQPTVAAVERVFYAKGVKSALSLGHARGVSLLAATSEGLPVYEYSASEVKRAVAGYGRAEKRQVQDMVRTLLNLTVSLSPDSADALAISICHLNTMRLSTKGYRN